jgi:hypothetical protein
MQKNVLQSLGILLISLCLSHPAVAQFDPTFMESRSARVIAKGVGETRVSSGFLWKNSEFVVTSLHGVPGGSDVIVECLGVKKKANVEKTLARADLILLSVKGLPSGCKPFLTSDHTKPAPYTPLWTFGHHAGARSGTSRMFVKGYATIERLDTLVSGAPLRAIKSFGMPATDLDIYYVEGGLLPGYSGGPVVDKNKKLIGIVDGGLNKGQSAYNWVIPAKYLDDLTSSITSVIPPQVAQSSQRHFSTGIDEVDEQTIVTFEEEGQKYTFVLTKTQSMTELAATADDAEGVDQLLNVFAPAAHQAAAEALNFDIYQEQMLGLIIAVPADQGLRFGDDGEGDKWLLSEGSDITNGFTGIRFAHSSFSDVTDDLGNIVPPSSADFFQNLVTSIVIDCNDPGITYCALDAKNMRIIDFGGGAKILRMGTTTYDYSGNAESYDYYSIAVKDNSAFGAQARIQVETSADTGIFPCLNSATPITCNDTTMARQQLSQLIGAHLTSFSGLAIKADQRVVETQFIYDNTRDNPSTIFVPYYEGDSEVLKFFNTRGTEWKVYVDNQEEGFAKEFSRDADNVVLQYQEDIYFSVPVTGGQYFQSTADNQWAPAGNITPKYSGSDNE